MFASEWTDSLGWH